MFAAPRFVTEGTLIIGFLLALFALLGLAIRFSRGFGRFMTVVESVNRYFDPAASEGKTLPRQVEKITETVERIGDRIETIAKEHSSRIEKSEVRIDAVEDRVDAIELLSTAHTKSTTRRARTSTQGDTK